METYEVLTTVYGCEESAGHVVPDRRALRPHRHYIDGFSSRSQTITHVPGSGGRVECVNSYNSTTGCNPVTLPAIQLRAKRWPCLHLM
jgi:hypothetical protein